MLKKAKNMPIKDRMIDAALALAAESPWQLVSFTDICEKADISETDAREYFDDKSDVLSAYGRLVDRKVIENTSFERSGNLSPREKLFDILMERYDIVNENRDAILSILSSFRNDPKQAVISLPHLGKSMERMLVHAGVGTDGLCGAIQVTGLIGIYLYVLSTWKEDESMDLAKTMAALDKALNIGEQAANSTVSGTIGSIFSKFRNQDTSE